MFDETDDVTIDGTALLEELRSATTVDSRAGASAARWTPPASARSLAAVEITGERAQLRGPIAVFVVAALVVAVVIVAFAVFVVRPA